MGCPGSSPPPQGRGANSRVARENSFRADSRPLQCASAEGCESQSTVFAPASAGGCRPQPHAAYQAMSKAIDIEPKSPSLYFGRGNMEQAAPLRPPSPSCSPFSNVPSAPHSPRPSPITILFRYSFTSTPFPSVRRSPSPPHASRPRAFSRTAPTPFPLAAREKVRKQEKGNQEEAGEREGEVCARVCVCLRARAQMNGGGGKRWRGRGSAAFVCSHSPPPPPLLPVFCVRQGVTRPPQWR